MRDPIYNLPIDPSRGICFVLILSVTRSNPNGDPERAGSPRIDYTGRNVFRNSAMKRYIRDSAKLHGAKLWMDHGVFLPDSMDPYLTDTGEVELDRAYDDLWDLRLLGGTVTAKGRNKLWAGKQIRNVCAGPLQMTDAVSLDPVEPQEIGLTRCAHGAETSEGDARANMGAYFIVEFAALRGHGEYLPNRSLDKVKPSDLALFWLGLIECWGESRANNRTGVNLRRLVTFDFPVGPGMEPKHVMQSRVISQRRDDDPNVKPTRFEDYHIGVDTTGLHPDVNVTVWNDGQTTILPAQRGVVALPQRTFHLPG